jgi:hypothetical protein
MQGTVRQVDGSTLLLTHHWYHPVQLSLQRGGDDEIALPPGQA